MKFKFRQKMAPVRRELAEQYLLVALIGFAGSVIITRFFLELSGYPRIEYGELHIAHVLWGGLFLFVSALLPLIYANKWALFWSALFSGIGFGLFIDEVGKFITSANDYFYPPAAPIIYAIFLITVLLYLYFRRTRKTTPREQLYHALHSIEELVDNDLDEDEKSALVSRLKYISEEVDDPNLSGLTRSLLSFINSDSIILSPRQEPQVVRWVRNISMTIDQNLTRARHRLVLILGLGATGALSAYGLYNLIWFLVRISRGQMVVPFFNLEDFPFVNSPTWIIIRIALQGLVGVLSLLAVFFFITKKDPLAVLISVLGLTVSLTVVNILIFYLDQFSAIIGALLEFVLLLSVIAYRRRFLTPQGEFDPQA
jgi:hypothetical protein